jgi:hypothetical protein
VTQPASPASLLRQFLTVARTTLVGILTGMTMTTIKDPQGHGKVVN